MGLFRRKRQEVPGLNTTSTADISFMLLIFFLVTSSMDTTKGLPRQMPQPELQTEREEMSMKERNVLTLVLDADDRLTCNDEVLTSEALVQRVADFVENANDDPQLPEKSQREVNLLGKCWVSDRHVITVEAHRDASYSAYFDMQNAIVKGYLLIRNKLAQQHFHCSFAACSAEERDAITMVYPQQLRENIVPSLTAERVKP